MAKYPNQSTRSIIVCELLAALFLFFLLKKIIEYSQISSEFELRIILFTFVSIISTTTSMKVYKKWSQTVDNIAKMLALIKFFLDFITNDLLLANLLVDFMIQFITGLQRLPNRRAHIFENLNETFEPFKWGQILCHCTTMHYITHIASQRLHKSRVKHTKMCEMVTQVFILLFPCCFRMRMSSEKRANERTSERKRRSDMINIRMWLKCTVWIWKNVG